MRKILLGLMALVLWAIACNAWARLVSVDPAPVDPNTGTNFNRYHYANNNPYKFTDPDGRQSRDFEAISREAGVSPATAPLKSPKDWLHKPLGIALGGVVAAPLLANPAVATTVVEAGMGDALGGASLVSGGVTLFRVVDNIEMQSIREFGRFLPSPSGDEVKRFLGNLPDAKALANEFSRFFGGEQQIVKGLAPQSVMDSAMRSPLSDVPGRQLESIAIPNEQLPNIKCVGQVSGC